ncbi:hypothetical protein NB640_06190 [Oxalobacter vibrioformis]|uniref:Uncharacterized protein n=1 Tax=Oxalobacter vibrioformis TaxID=933080 RepID=A0A9E9LZ88_9BURK|nr:hypothetical protein [Oxalobacter vibrioformis]WAW11216.1 hypothetical protein NB640_06190 [Oxalobacter vibrioformis]
MPKPLFRTRILSPAIAGLLIGLASLSSGYATAADSGMADAKAQYEKDKAACLNDSTTNDINACLRDAGATYQSRIKGKQKNQPVASNSNFRENAIERCRIFRGDDRSQCEHRIMDGPVEGSVRKGGILYESSTREILSRNP